jgi:NAD(P)-dependent dehydrogenase (short-subunit alcohol dehydrogenase family)
MRVERFPPDPDTEPRHWVWHDQAFAMMLRPGSIEWGSKRSALEKFDYAAGDLTLCDRHVGEWVGLMNVQKLGSIDALVNNAGIFFTKPFTDYTVEDFKALSSTNLEGFIYVTQGAVKQVLAQKSGGSVVSITAALVDNPIAGIAASVPMISKGGLEAITRSLATEYAKEKIRFNAVAPGVVDTALHKDNPKDFLKTLSPIVEAVVYLTEARQVTGEVLHVDGGAHSGKW